MTETLHHSPSSKPEQLDERYARQLASLRKIQEQEQAPTSEAPVEPETTETHDDTREVSPFAVRVRSAAERFATRLEKRAVSRAHDEALKEYRDRDHDAYTDHLTSLADDDTNLEAQKFNSKLLRKDERRANREEFIEDASLQLRALGGLGVEKAVDISKDAGLIAVGLGAMGYEAAASRARGALLKHEMNADGRRFRKNYAKETKQFDKEATRGTKKLHKQQKAEMRAAKREDRTFERSMRRKARGEKWEDRAQKVSETYNAKKEATVVRLENGARRTGEAYRATKESYESKKDSVAEKKQKLGAFAVKARSAGQAAVAAGREELKK